VTERRINYSDSALSLQTGGYTCIDRPRFREQSVNVMKWSKPKLCLESYMRVTLMRDTLLPYLLEINDYAWLRWAPNKIDSSCY